MTPHESEAVAYEPDERLELDCAPQSTKADVVSIDSHRMARLQDAVDLLPYPDTIGSLARQRGDDYAEHIQALVAARKYDLRGNPPAYEKEAMENFHASVETLLEAIIANHQSEHVPGTAEYLREEQQNKRFKEEVVETLTRAERMSFKAARHSKTYAWLSQLEPAAQAAAIERLIGIAAGGETVAPMKRVRELKEPAVPKASRAKSAATERVLPEDEAAPTRRVDTDTYSDFYQRVLKKIPIPSHEQQMAWTKQIERGDMVAKEKMIVGNLRLVADLAHRSGAPYVSQADRFEMGVVGLIRAVEKFDWRKGNHFSTYATLWIRQAIQRGCEDTGRTIRVPVHIEQKLNKLRRHTRELTQKHGREATDAELGEAMGITPEQLHELYDADRRPASLEAPVGDDGETEFGSLLPDHRHNPVAAVIEAEENDLDRLLKPLTTLQRSVLIGRLGLDGGAGWTATETGRQLGIPRERVSSIEERALEILQEYRADPEAWELAYGLPVLLER